jgi:hypothetical protein
MAGKKELYPVFHVLYVSQVKAPKVGYSWYTLSTNKDLVSNVRKTLLEGCGKVTFLKVNCFNVLVANMLALLMLKYPDSFFKIKLHPYGTFTILTNRKLIDELRRSSPDGALDFTGGTRVRSCMDLGNHITTDDILHADRPTILYDLTQYYRTHVPHSNHPDNTHREHWCLIRRPD